MNPIYSTYRPSGFGTISSYLFVTDPLRYITFLKEAYFAEEIGRTIDERDDSIANCILKIGTTCMMVSQARGDFKGMRAAMYLFVDDVDAMTKRAIDHGASSLFPPEDMDYGDRQSGVVDPAGNYWWISKRIEERGYHD